MSLSHAKDDERNRAREVRRVILATLIGTTLEWYDFFLYATCAVLVFGPLFFPAGDSVAGQLGAMATFTVGFLARPLGGIIAGHFGDRVGRKRMLSLTLTIMGLSTVGVGLVPTYAQAGVWAPALLVTMRVIQGLAMGGEWGGAVSMATEHAPPNRKTLYAAAPAVGPAIGLVLANLVLIGLTSATGASFGTWGWRIAFLGSILLVAVGVLARRQLAESPLFEESVAKAPESVPVLEVLRSHGGTLLKTIFVAGIPAITTYMLNVYMLGYGTKTDGYDHSSLLWLSTAINALSAVLQVYAARLSDRFGMWPVLMVGAVSSAVTAFLLFPLFDSRNLALAALASIIVISPACVSLAVVPAFLTEQFPPKIRYTGISMAYQIGSIVGGGFAPLIADAILAGTGKPWLISGYMAGANLVALVCLLLLRKKPAWQLKAEEQTAGAVPTQADGRDLVGDVPASGS